MANSLLTPKLTAVARVLFAHPGTQMTARQISDEICANKDVDVALSSLPTFLFTLSTKGVAIRTPSGHTPVLWWMPADRAEKMADLLGVPVPKKAPAPAAFVAPRSDTEEQEPLPVVRPQVGSVATGRVTVAHLNLGGDPLDPTAEQYTGPQLKAQDPKLYELVKKQLGWA